LRKNERELHDYTMTLNTSHDWLSDLQPVFAAQESWLDGSYHKIAWGHLICPNDRPFSIACGAALLAEHVRSFRFSPSVIQRLGQVTDKQGRSVFQESFLNHLQRMRLRAHISAAPEGTLLLPGEPLLFIQAPELQIRLLESALQRLVWESTHWATQAAREQWVQQRFSEEETPHAPRFPSNKAGWKRRAMYIGGSPHFDLENAGQTEAPDWSGTSKIEQAPNRPLVQIRRLFKGEQPLGDVWLTAAQDAAASVSHTHIQFLDEKRGQVNKARMSRYLNLMQPVLVKGHPALNTPSLDYLRQRNWKQLEAFHNLDLEKYPRGWYIEDAP